MAEQKHILILEDEPSTLTLLEDIVASAGHRVTGAKDGTAALKLARSDPPDLAVVDLIVPGLSGFQLISMLRRDGNFAGVPIVVVSGRSRDEDIRAALEAGANLFLSKPIDRDKLLAGIAGLLSPGD